MDAFATYLRKLIQEAAVIFVSKTRQYMLSEPKWNEIIDMVRKIMKTRLQK
jgi:hypothetical protein